jgi:hypothetical protein
MTAAKTRQKQGTDVDAFCNELKLGVGIINRRLHELSNLVQNDRKILAMTMALVQTNYYRTQGTDLERREFVKGFIGDLLTISRCVVDPAEKDDKEGKKAFFAFVEVVRRCGPTAADVIVSGLARNTERVFKPYENSATARYALEAMTKVLLEYPAARGVGAEKLTKMLEFMSKNLDNPELIMDVAEVIGRDLYRSSLRRKAALGAAVPGRTFAVMGDATGLTRHRRYIEDERVAEEI